jgi:cell pole-organizing protein PopZ
MKQPAHDEKLFMEGTLAAIRRAKADEEAGEMTSTSTSRVAEAGPLSRDATATIGSALNTLTETVKQHQPSLEHLVGETLRPMLKSWLDENLPGVAERMVQAEIERVSKNQPAS